MIMIESRVRVVVLFVFTRREARGGEEVGTVEEGDGACATGDGREVLLVCWIGHGEAGRREEAEEGTVRRSGWSTFLR